MTAQQSVPPELVALLASLVRKRVPVEGAANPEADGTWRVRLGDVTLWVTRWETAREAPVDRGPSPG